MQKDVDAEGTAITEKESKWVGYPHLWVGQQRNRALERLSEEQLAAQAALPEDQCLPVTDSHIIIYPGKGFDDWWNLKQLMDAMVHTINIFEYTHPGKVSDFLFDCSSAHEGLAPDALNVNNMNINPGGKQKHLWSITITPLQSLTSLTLMATHKLSHICMIIQIQIYRQAKRFEGRVAGVSGSVG